MADGLLDIDQLKEAFDPRHLLALVCWHFLHNFNGNLIRRQNIFSDTKSDLIW